MISVICPVYNEEKYIESCIESILRQDYPKNDMEVLFVDGRSEDSTRDIINRFIDVYPFIKLLDNPKRIAPCALNIGIKSARGDTIIRIDAHARYPDNYFSALVSKLRELNADNVGGICRTLPADSTPKCRAIASAMSSPFGMGNSYFRIGTEEEKKVDTVPFGCFPRAIFDKVGLFDEELVRNQDDEFNGRIIQSGGSIWLIPNIVVDYYARNSLLKTMKMFYQYGLFKPLVNKKLQKPTTLRQFFPPLFVAGLVFGALLSIFSKSIAILYLSIVALYVALSVVFAAKNAKSMSEALWMCLIFFAIHTSYGTGYWIGFFKTLFNRNMVVVSNH